MPSSDRDSMIRPEPAPATELIATGLPIDHIGIVVHDLAAEVSAWRAAGFLVSDPVPLFAAGTGGASTPLGQSSAHVVFHNGYVELSSPDPRSGNHLEPYLALGEAVRILVFTAADAADARLRLLVRWPHLAEVRQASRTVVAGERRGLAMFRWFPLPESIAPGMLCAVVEHRTRDLVLDRSLCAHPNGWTRIANVIGAGRAADLIALPALEGAPTDAPALEIVTADRELAIVGLTLAAEGRPEAFFRVG